jgi:hypothetical protein
MSLYVTENTIRILQLQGYLATDIPVPLRNWPRRFVEACQELAIKNHFKEVQIPKAHSLGSYRYPSIQGAKTEANLKAAHEGVRTRMRSHYDGTARELGFADRGNWFVWANPYASEPKRNKGAPDIRALAEQGFTSGALWGRRPVRRHQAGPSDFAGSHARSRLAGSAAPLQ